MTASTEWRAAPAGFTEEDRAALAETLGASIEDVEFTAVYEEHGGIPGHRLEGVLKNAPAPAAEAPVAETAPAVEAPVAEAPAAAEPTPAQ